MILLLLTAALSFWIGYIMRDRYIQRSIRNAVISTGQTDLCLIGSSIDYIRSLSLYDDIEPILNAVELDTHTDGTFVPPLVKRYLRKYISYMVLKSMDTKSS
jgi:hypothetical protein